MLFKSLFGSSKLCETRTEYVAAQLIAAVCDVKFEERRVAALPAAERHRKATPAAKLEERTRELVEERLRQGAGAHDATAHVMGVALSEAAELQIDLYGAISSLSFAVVSVVQSHRGSVDEAVAGVLTGVRRFVKGTALKAEAATSLASASAVRATLGNRTWDVGLADIPAGVPG